MMIEYSWYGWRDMSKILLIARIVLMTIIIYMTSYIWDA